MNINYKKTLMKLNDFISGLCFKHFPEKKSLIIFTFHHLFNDDAEGNSKLLFPQGKISLQKFRFLIEYFLENDYVFIRPENILNGLDNSKKYIMFTFDDGYYNNIRAISLLKEYDISAIFFIASSYIKKRKCFWWDVLYRERKKAGISDRNIFTERTYLKYKKFNFIKDYLISEFGEKIFKPASDLDRPLTAAELKLLSENKYVYIGNHTSHHEVMSSLTLDEIESTISNAQQDIFEMVGYKPNLFSYPYGNYSKQVLEITHNLGIKFGFSTIPQKNYLPIRVSLKNTYNLNRYTVSDRIPILRQCCLSRSDFQFIGILENIKYNIHNF